MLRTGPGLFLSDCIVRDHHTAISTPYSSRGCSPVRRGYAMQRVDGCTFTANSVGVLGGGFQVGAAP